MSATLFGKTGSYSRSLWVLGTWSNWSADSTVTNENQAIPSWLTLSFVVESLILLPKGKRATSEEGTEGGHP